MTRANWAGVAAIILAVGVASAVIMLAIGSVFQRHINLDASEAELLGTVVGAAIGAVATYLGAGHGDGSDPPPSA